MCVYCPPPPFPCKKEEELDEALFGTYTLSRPDEIPSVPVDLANPMGVNEGAGTLLDQLASGQVRSPPFISPAVCSHTLFNLCHGNLLFHVINSICG
jgi:hypothetical protein